MQNDTTAQPITLVLNAWADQNKRVTDFFNKYPDEAYMEEVAEGRNRAIYLLGHLAAVNDALIPLLGFGDKLHPEMESIFLKERDKAVGDLPTIAELKTRWDKINTTLTNHFNQLEPTDWLDRHMSVSPEDFAKEPHRNRLNVIIGRTIHQSYHIGQLAFLKQKELA